MIYSLFTKIFLKLEKWTFLYPVLTPHWTLSGDPKNWTIQSKTGRLVGLVIGIDHVQELIEKSNVILKENFAFLKNKVIFIACDGRNGFPIGGPYDVINIGGAVTEISETILSQLKPGGRLVAPVGPMNDTQELVTIDKLDDGTLKREYHMKVIFGSLKSLRSQLEQLKK